MHHLRLLSVVLLCTLSLVGRSTSSPGTRTAYLGPLDRSAGAGPPGAAPAVERADGGLAARDPQRSLAESALDGADVSCGCRRPPRFRHLSRRPPVREPPPAPGSTHAALLGQADEEILSRICQLPIKQFKPLGRFVDLAARPSTEGCRRRSSRIRCGSRAISRKSRPIASRGHWAWIWCRRRACVASRPNS